MGTLNIQLMGICTNFRISDHPALPVRHRVVLIRADNLPAMVFGHVIPPHFASLQVGPARIPLTGTKIEVRNEQGNGCTYEPSFDEAPNLTALMKGTLGEASLPILVGDNSGTVAACLDLNSGTFTACSSSGAATTTITVTTDGAPVLRLTPFSTAAFPLPVSTDIDVADGSTIVLQNVASDETDGAHHFLLHYLTARILPADPNVLTSLNLPICPPTNVGGVGCSDSNYP